MNSGKILYFSEDIKFLLKNKNNLRKWIKASISHEKMWVGSINFIFCSDKYLLQLNQKYLNHNTYTDIITFDNSDSQHEISGDLYISVERVRENSKQFSGSFVIELQRVMIHGILHLLGYNDKSSKDKETMRNKEDYYLSLLPDFKL